ncbi:MAG TPA: Holliday junction branch migration protein RuvA [Sedimentisphaerales bacterium]|nr:Holliday junction branch migration protein RuvA [Sedimentisphaerales bacterium]
MIAQIRGKLLKLDAETAQLEVSQIVYEVNLPGYAVSALAGSIGQEITLHTTQYLEGNPGGSTFYPRMIGFLNGYEKTFFVKYTSVKGIGIKKALRSLSLPIATIAAAIEVGDEKLLATLPEVGKRLSQQIVVELKGKLQSFAVTDYAMAARSEFKPFQAEALEILIAWGEKRNDAIELVNMACRKHPDIKTAEELVPLVYRLKQGVEA